MNRRTLIHRIAREARRKKLRWELAREGANHSIFDLDGLLVTVPRHSELNEFTALGILTRCAEKFGPKWWRR